MCHDRVGCMESKMQHARNQLDVAIDNNNNNILIYKAQLHKSAQSAVQLLRNAYKTCKT